MTWYKLAAVAGVLLAVAGGQARAQDAPPPFPPCAGEDPDGLFGIAEIRAVLLERSIHIIRLANTGDEAALAELVARDATFRVSNGDVVVSFEGASGGASGLVRFFASMRNPTSYLAVRSRQGMYLVDPCREQTVSLILRHSDHGDEYEARWFDFTWENGVLQSIGGYDAVLSEGDTSD